MAIKIKSPLISLLSAFFGILALLNLLGSTSVYAQNIIQGNPSNYDSLLSQLNPGDTLLLEAGNYEQLYISNLNGESENSIVIMGPKSGPKAVVLGDYGTNTVEIHDSSYLEIRNLEIDCRNRGGDGINAKTVTHHITLENLYIHGFSDHQQTVGISANHAPSWNWIIRNNIITDGGTGIYLGNSDGREQFISGIIEHNLIYDTIGYNMEIKHQNPRPDISGIPTGKSTTIIRHNVFSKSNNASSETAARPNLLVGHFPLSGPGKDDEYHIYGNLFYQNPYEPLFQGEGNIAFYDNLLVNTMNSNYAAIFISPHNDIPKMIRIFNNIIVSKNSGISVSGGDPLYEQKVIGNAVFSNVPISAADQMENIVDSFSNATNYLNNPFGELGVDLDLHPKPGMLKGSSIDYSSVNTFTDWNKDFNRNLHDGTFRGAYASEGVNPGLLLKLERKPVVVDTTPPLASQNLTVTVQSESQISLTWQESSDPESGISKYNIYRNGSLLGNTTATSFSDTGLTENTLYTYEVTAINGTGLESDKSNASSATTFADTTSPAISSLSTIVLPSRVVVVFSEHIEQSSAEDILNYSIDNGITILTASLDSDLKTVTLSTSTHIDGESYTLTVNNIKDRANAPNAIAHNTQKTYTFISHFIISNLKVGSGRSYEVISNGLAVGSLVYIDRGYNYASVPSSLQGATYIKTANDDKSSSDASFVTFDINKHLTIYVAHDNRITVKPSWLSSFTDTGKDTETNEPVPTRFSLYAKDFPAGKVTLGGNESSDYSMYGIIIDNGGTTSIDIIPPSPPTGLRRAH